MASHQATTTAVIRDIAGLDRAGLTSTLRMSLLDQGWPGGWADDLVDDLIRWGAAWPEGTVLERHLDFVGVRFDPMTGALRAPFRAPAGWPFGR